MPDPKASTEVEGKAGGPARQTSVPTQGWWSVRLSILTPVVHVPAASVVLMLSRQTTGKVRIDSVKLVVEPAPTPPGMRWEVTTAYVPANETPPNIYVARLEPGKTEVEAELYHGGEPSLGYVVIDDIVSAPRILISIAGRGGPYRVKAKIAFKTLNGKRTHEVTASDSVLVMP